MFGSTLSGHLEDAPDLRRAVWIKTYNALVSWSRKKDCRWRPQSRPAAVSSTSSLASAMPTEVWITACETFDHDVVRCRNAGKRYGK